MKKLKYFIFATVFFSALILLFGPDVIPENSLSRDILDLAADREVIIIFNSGGWGNTPLEAAKDFAPIVKGIQDTLEDKGYSSIVLPYNRTKDNLLGKIAGARDFLNSFKFSSETLAEKIEFLSENLPDKKIILAGLSAGGALTSETIKKISDKAQGSVYAITAGIPFWEEAPRLENILKLDNGGRDSLAAGKMQSLLLSLAKSPFRWIASQINGKNLTFSQAIQAPGHDYEWSSPEVGSQIVMFLESKFAGQ